MDRLPGVLGDIADVAGLDAALAIAAARGGTQIYVPPRPAVDHWLCQMIGYAQAQEVADLLTAGVGPIRITLPLGPAGHQAKVQAAADAMIAQGKSERDIALATGYTTRTVRRRRKMLASGGKLRDERQFSLL